MSCKPKLALCIKKKNTKKFTLKQIKNSADSVLSARRP